MSESSTFATWDLLQDLGFQKDTGYRTDISPTLYFDFGNFRLFASCVTNMRFREVISFGGLIQGGSVIAQVEFEMPIQVESREQCAAWIIWHLDQGGHISHLRQINWVEEGRKNQKLLPWYFDREAYEARPHCLVQRDWLRLALKTLSDYIGSVSDDMPIYFRFDGKILSIECGEKLVVLPGDGQAWSHKYSILAKTLRYLPKRLAHNRVEISVLNNSLSIGHYGFLGITEIPDTRQSE